MKLSDHKNTKKQGDAGVGTAIGYFSKLGYSVSIPLTDSQDYDLVVDIDDKLNRVQVKTTTVKTEYGVFAVGLRVLGGNQSWNKVPKFFDSSKVEYLFVLTEDGDQYFIPTTDIKSKSGINLGKKYEKFKV